MDSEFLKFITTIYLSIDASDEDKIRHVNSSFETMRTAHHAFEDYKRKCGFNRMCCR